MKTLADLTAPAEVEHVMLEADLQDKCVDWIRRRGYWARKFSSISQRSVPDYLFAKKIAKGIDTEHLSACVDPLKFATEFKKPGTKPKLLKKHGVTVMSTEAQYEEQLAMQAAGWITFECDDLEEFKSKVYMLERGETI